MSQKRRNDRFRRTLQVESLEDRTLLTGNVIAGEISLLFGNHLIIQNDGANNNISINLVLDNGVPNIRVQGAPFNAMNPFAATGVNGTTGGYIDTPLSSVNTIDINNPAVFGPGGGVVNGNVNIQIGNVAGFSIPGNINVFLGTGKDTLSLNKVGANLLTFTSVDHTNTSAPDPNFGVIGSATATGSDTVTVTNSIHGEDHIVAGLGQDNITISGQTAGLVYVSTPGPKNDTVSVVNNTYAPLPRTAALGILSVYMGTDNFSQGTGSNTFNLTGSSAGVVAVTMGDSHAGDGSSSITETANIVNDTISGAGLSLTMLNGAGQNGSGPGGAANESYMQATFNNVFFQPGNGNLSVTLDDSAAFTRNSGGGVTGGSELNEILVDFTHDCTATVGKNFYLVQFGNSDSPANVNDIDTGMAELLVYGGADRVKINVHTYSSLGNGNLMVDIDATGPADLNLITMNGIIAGAADVFFGDEWTANFGVNPPSGGTGLTVAGSLYINPFSSPFTAYTLPAPIAGFFPTHFPPNGCTVSVTSASVGGLLLVDLGTNDATHNTESVTIGAAGAPVTTKDLDVEDTATNLSGSDSFFDNVFNVTNTTVTDTNSGTMVDGIYSMLVFDFGIGANDLATLGGKGAVGDPIGLGGGPLTVASGMYVGLGVGGVNLALVENVSALLGQVDGGGGPSSNFIGVGPQYGNINIIAMDFATTA
jgi:hypothetical protein